MGLKISEYVNAHTVPAAGDLYDVSADLGGGSYESRSIAWSVITGGVNSIYNNNGTIGAGRVATITDTLTFTGGKSIFGASAVGYASMNLGNGVNPSTPVDGDVWYNGTELFFRDGATNVNLLGGNGIYDASSFIGLDRTVTLSDGATLDRSLTFAGITEANLLHINSASDKVQIGTALKTTESLLVNGRVAVGAATSQLATFTVQAISNSLGFIYKGSSGVDILKMTGSSSNAVVKFTTGGNNSFDVTGASIFRASSIGILGFQVLSSTGAIVIATGTGGSPNVGIGTAADATNKLKVNGPTQIDGSLTVDGSANVSGVYKVGGVSGFTGAGTYTSFTIVGGIITAAS